MPREPSNPRRNHRPALTGPRIVAAAAAVADRDALVGVSMRTVARELGVEAMSLYHHIAGKEALLDALVDHVFAQITLPIEGDPWRPAMASHAVSAREVLARHPWGLGLIESRSSPGPVTLAHHNAMLGCLRGNGFPVRLASHAVSALDAYVYGFVLTEVSLPFKPGESAEEFVRSIQTPMAAYPHLLEMVRVQVLGQDYAYGDEFEYGLDLILDSLERRLVEVQGDLT